MRAFHAELAATVRSVSPFLLSLLEVNGLSLDEIVQRMKPPCGWPGPLRLGAMTALWPPAGYFLSHHTIGQYPNDRLPGTRCSTMVRADCGGWMAVRIEANTIEVSACLGDARFFTRFGSLQICLCESIPATLATASLGRLAEEVVGHPALDGQGWAVVACEVQVEPLHGTTLTVETGSAFYRMPSAR